MGCLCCSDADIQSQKLTAQAGVKIGVGMPFLIMGQDRSGIGSPTSPMYSTSQISDGMQTFIMGLGVLCAPLVPQCSASSKV